MHRTLDKWKGRPPAGAAKVECCTTVACMQGPSPAVQAPTLAGQSTCQGSYFLAHLGLMQHAADHAHWILPSVEPFRIPHPSSGSGPKAAIAHLAQLSHAATQLALVCCPCCPCKSPVSTCLGTVWSFPNLPDKCAPGKAGLTQAEHPVDPAPKLHTTSLLPGRHPPWQK